MKKDDGASKPLDLKKIQTLIQSGKAQLVLPALQSALEEKPEDKDLLTLAAAAEMSLHRFNFAAPYFHSLLRLDPNNQAVREQLRTLHRRLVGAWHFSMMNDLRRNEAFERAIQNAVEPGTLVFEIGSGSGLLAMMAARAGAERVVSCERVIPIAMVAANIVAENGYSGRVVICPKNSLDIEIGRELPRKADLLIAEILGPSVVEEGVFQFLGDAKKRLLRPGGKIIPARAEVYAFLLESVELFHGVRVGEVSGFNLSRFNSLYEEPLIEVQLTRMNSKALSDSRLVTTLDFAGEHSPLVERELRFTVTKEGTCHGIAQWFRLYTDNSHYLDTSPKADASHWRQVVQVFDKPLYLSAGDELRVTVTERHNRFSYSVCPE